jgi:hypothetical protein
VTLPPHYAAAYDQYLKEHKEVRFRLAAYYERLALIDAGTIALACTTLLGSGADRLKHQYTLCLGLVCLLAALVSLLYRNFTENYRESAMTNQQYALRLERDEIAEKYQPRIDQLGLKTKVLEIVGVFGTMTGLAVLSIVLILSVI